MEHQQAADEIAFNNRAVALLTQGRYAEALTNLIDAFRHLESLCNTLDQQSLKMTSVQKSCDDDDEDGCDDEEMMDVTEGGNAANCVESVEVPSLRNPPASSPRTTYGLYNRALLLTSTKQRLCHEPLSYYFVTAATLYYNVALVYHVWAMEQDGSPELERALDMYEQAHHIIDNFAECFVDVELLLYALVNNMGHVHSCLLNESETQRMFNRLRLMIDARSFTMTSEQPTDDASPVGRSREDLALFLRNVRIEACVLYQAAPAA